jgi:hypothetical protein
MIANNIYSGLEYIYIEAISYENDKDIWEWWEWLIAFELKSKGWKQKSALNNTCSQLILFNPFHLLQNHLYKIFGHACENGVWFSLCITDWEFGLRNLLFGIGMNYDNDLHGDFDVYNLNLLLPLLTSYKIFRFFWLFQQILLHLHYLQYPYAV